MCAWPSTGNKRILKRQRGVVVIAAATLLAAISSLLVLGIQADIKRLLLLSGDSASAAVSRAADEIRAWYERNAWEIEANPGILNTAGITTEAVLLASSRQLEKNGIRYHVIAAWRPVPGVTGTRLDPNTGIFYPGRTSSGNIANVHHAIVNGYSVQASRAMASKKRIQKIASVVENWVRVKQAHDPDNEDRNWIRRTNCTVDNGAIPCYDASVPVESTVMGSLVGISQLDFRNAWGRPIYVSNANGHVYPYRLTLRTNTPWGGSYTVEAVQR